MGSEPWELCGLAVMDVSPGNTTLLQPGCETFRAYLKAPCIRMIPALV